MDSRKTKTRGQELVEYAITLPLFLLLVFGIFDLGRGAYAYSVLQNAAREGARFAIVNPGNDAGIEARVRERAIGLDQDDITVLAPAWTEDTVQVIVEYEFTPVTPFVGAIIPGGTVTIQSSSTMLREKW
jgi:hypothetical protein